MTNSLFLRFCFKRIPNSPQRYKAWQNIAKDFLSRSTGAVLLLRRRSFKPALDSDFHRRPSRKRTNVVPKETPSCPHYLGKENTKAEKISGNFSGPSESRPSAHCPSCRPLIVTFFPNELSFPDGIGEHRASASVY